MITWYYHVVNGATIRAPIDLETRAIDWRRIEPWHEPPLVSRVRTRCRTCHDSGGCKHTRDTRKAHDAMKMNDRGGTQC